MHKNRKPIPLGKTFNRLTILTDLGTDSKYKRHCLASCICGKVKQYIVSAITSGKTKSCGCYQIDHPARLVHGDAKTPLYKRYYSMLLRCHVPSSSGYYNYGAKGITVCDVWRESYQEFKMWALANGYDESLSIDRINTKGNYEPTNCRFVPMTTQALNKPAPITNTSGIKNVHWNASKKRWIPRITVAGKRIEIGRFKSKNEAAAALANYLQKHKLTEHIRGHSYD